MKFMRHSGLIWVVWSVVILLADRYTKLYMLNNLSFGNPQPVLPVLSYTLAFNTGAAFSFLHNASGWQNIFFSCLAAVVSLVILKWLWEHPAREWWSNFALSAILGGALGNVWDRLTYGYVIDFIDFHWGGLHFAIFNVADSAVCVGAVMMILYWSRASARQQS